MLEFIVILSHISDSIDDFVIQQSFLLKFFNSSQPFSMPSRTISWHPLMQLNEDTKLSIEKFASSTAVAVSSTVMIASPSAVLLCSDQSFRQDFISVDSEFSDHDSAII